MLHSPTSQIQLQYTTSQNISMRNSVPIVTYKNSVIFLMTLKVSEVLNSKTDDLKSENCETKRK